MQLINNFNSDGTPIIPSDPSKSSEVLQVLNTPEWQTMAESIIQETVERLLNARFLNQ
jgi:hypothetical protein